MISEGSVGGALLALVAVVFFVTVVEVIAVAVVAVAAVLLPVVLVVRGDEPPAVITAGDESVSRGRFLPDMIRALVLVLLVALLSVVALLLGEGCCVGCFGRDGGADC